MQETGYRAIAIVGAGAVLPDAPGVPAFWTNIQAGRDSITEVSAERWDPALYYDADRNAPDKTYSKIGGWVREYQWDPFGWRMAIPPRVADAMDLAQRWAIGCTREALADYGYPERRLDTERTAVILGNAMAGEKHYFTALRAFFPEYAHQLDECKTFAALPPAVRRDITREWHDRLGGHLPPITEDSMPGELANCLAGRIANLFNFRGPNFTCDAACASAMAAMRAAAEGLAEHDFDAAITGGIDRNMGAPTFIKFCKIGALSATGSRPYADGADGFVMGEGAALFLMKRLEDAERDGDRIYAVIRGIGASSDGKGKGITAPNPVGQKIAVERAWQNAGISPATATMIEGHGTSTSVGDVVEVESIAAVLREHGRANGHGVALGSVKSNIGHLKGAAGAAGVLKTALALHHKMLPPSIHCGHPNSNIDFAHSPLAVNTQLRPWTETDDGVRRAGVSAFGFGGTNFHLVMEEHIPGRIQGNGRAHIQISETPGSDTQQAAKVPLRGAAVIGAPTETALIDRLKSVYKDAIAGLAPATTAPAEEDLRAPYRLAMDYGNATELADKAAKALRAFEGGQAGAWKALQAQGIFRGEGPAPKITFLYTGQGSQYVNMLRALRQAEPIIKRTFAEADAIMAPLLGKPLTEFIFTDPSDEHAVMQSEDALRQTAITQPAVLATDLGITRLLAAYGIQPDMAMGHSLGEYGALVASGSLSFADALEAVSARGREMTRVTVTDNGRMAAVFAPIQEIERILKTVPGYVVIANINSRRQAVIGGASVPVEAASRALLLAGYNVVPLPVSHAFHTSIVAPASEPLRRMLERLNLKAPRIPVIANVDGQFYPAGPDAVPKMLDILARQIASPVQFTKGLETLYSAGARVFAEVGPKKALHGFVEDVLGAKGDVMALFTNHPKTGDVAAFNQALCGMYAAGLGRGEPRPARDRVVTTRSTRGSEAGEAKQHHSAGFLKSPVAITGAALGLPGSPPIFDDGNLARILNGEQCIDVIPTRFRKAILDKHITRLVKTDQGGPAFESIKDPADVLKLAGRGGAFDLTAEFGIAADRVAAMDRITCLAVAVGMEAMRDAGIPLVMRYKSTTKGTRLPDRWSLPDSLRDDTGVIFASVFPGYNSFADEMARYYADHSRREQLAALESLKRRAAESNGHSGLANEIERRIAETQQLLEKEPYFFDRRFIFRALSMGHSQFAELVGARGPNTQVNAACASTTQAVAIAEDWIKTGRCRRVVIISADDITSDPLIEWFGAAFLASGAAATDEIVENAATPFDRRRHGMIIGMGAAAMVLESADAAAERGLQPICEVLGAVTANSAFHGTRLDPSHIARVMESLVAHAEAESGLPRQELAGNMVFVSHETYTPARGGSASAEVHALRTVFGDSADRIVIANTKGFTGHAMGAGIEDVVAVKCLETGCVPPVANFKEVDPELGPLNLSHGGAYPVRYALRLGAGFGSQISMTLIRRIVGNGTTRRPGDLGYAYRITDQEAWQKWLEAAAGPAPELEVVHRTLRVRDRAHGMSTPAVAEPIELKAPQPRREMPIPVEALADAVSPGKTGVAATSAAAATPEISAADTVLAIVAEKTGYPAEMLALDLDLEADLGIDTVKQAEMFAAVREAFGISRDPSLKLRDFPTLGHVIRYAEEKRTGAPPASASSAAVEPLAPPQAQTAVSARDRVLAIVAEKTGYPAEMLALDLDLEADLGVDTVKQAEMFAAVREAFGIARDPNLKLRDFPTLGHVIRYAEASGGAAKPSAGSPAARGHSAPPAPPEPTPEPQETVPAVSRPTAVPVESDGFIRERVLAIVAEKTGYPAEMIEPDLDLEADLGIDTVKQAEMFAAVREAFGIARDPRLTLRDFPTLGHVIRFAMQSKAVATAQSPVAAKAPPPDLPPSDAHSSARETVLGIVAEKTGYPKDMLDPDLDLEADLGIDTVKQAEMFAAVREAFGVARDPNLKLRDFPTLGHVIRFAEQAQRKTAPVRPVDIRTPAPDASLPAIPRRVPAPVLRPPLTLAKETGISLAPGRRVLIAPDAGGAGRALAARLNSLGVEVVTTPDERPLDGVYWLPALDFEGEIAAMDLADWRAALRVRVKLLYELMRAHGDEIGRRGTFLISATRLGGLHGYGEAGAIAPLGGSVTGFTKAYKRERPEALVKTVDFELAAAPEQIAELLVQETLRDNGAVEIGYHSGQRWTIGLEDRPVAEGSPDLKLSQDTVFVITGAAGSIVSAITADLAASTGATFHLLDLAPEPDPRNHDLARFGTDREGLKREIYNRIQSRGERATPALVEKELANLERAHAAWEALSAVRSAGGTACYHTVDLTDAAAVAAVVEQIRRRSGRIDVLLHAAGMERSHFLREKEPREFDLVFDVKADGWFNLFHAIGAMPLGAVVAFSSVAGRFGNAGQTDYSAANDLLSKLVSSFRATRPHTRAVAVDWTAWAGIGMAARGSIPKMMEMAGIEMLPPATGIPWIRRELTEGAASGEVVVAGKLGVLGEEWDKTRGLKENAELKGPMLGTLTELGQNGAIRIETMLEPAVQPFLYDHQIEGIPVLPGVMGMEGFAEAAATMAPGWKVTEFEHVSFLAPFKFYRREPRRLTIEAAFRREKEELVADCRLVGRRTIPNLPEPQTTEHFTGQVRLANHRPAPGAPLKWVKPDCHTIAAAEIYQLYFHGPAYQVVRRAWWHRERVVAEMSRNLPAGHQPAAEPLAASPRLIELCFQAAGLWEMANLRRMGLPRQVDRVRIYRTPEAVIEPLFAIVRPTLDGEAFDAEVVDQAGNVYLQMTGYCTVAFRENLETELLQGAEAVTG